MEDAKPPSSPPAQEATTRNALAMGSRASPVMIGLNTPPAEAGPSQPQFAQVPLEENLLPFSHADRQQPHRQGAGISHPYNVDAQEHVHYSSSFTASAMAGGHDGSAEGQLPETAMPGINVGQESFAPLETGLQGGQGSPDFAFLDDMMSMWNMGGAPTFG